MFDERNLSAGIDEKQICCVIYEGAFRMRHLLNTLFVTTEDAYLTLDGENTVVKRECPRKCVNANLRDDDVRVTLSQNC